MTDFLFFDSEVLFAINGVCEESSCICSEKYIPVCGSKGAKETTYGNYCSMFCAYVSYYFSFFRYFFSMFSKFVNNSSEDNIYFF